MVQCPEGQVQYTRNGKTLCRKARTKGVTNNKRTQIIQRLNKIISLLNKQNSFQPIARVQNAPPPPRNSGPGPRPPPPPPPPPPRNSGPGPRPPPVKSNQKVNSRAMMLSELKNKISKRKKNN